MFRPLLIGTAAIAAVGVAVAATFFVLRGGDADQPTGPAQAVLAGDRFTVGDATTDGRIQRLTDVAVVGSTVVTAGEDSGVNSPRGRLLVSTDSGRTFRPAEIKGPNGQDAALVDVPQLVAGSGSGWVAIGRRPAGGVVWTSQDGGSWQRLPNQASAVFQPQDRVNRVRALSSGFIAVGVHTAKGDLSDAQPVVWLSSDGRAWQRLTGDRLGIDAGGDAIVLNDVVTDGRVLLIEARRIKNAGRDNAVSSGAVWRSDDGGRSWKLVPIPAPKGSSGIALGGGPNGLLALREIRDGDDQYAQVFTSSDGSTWDRGGRIETSGYQRTGWLFSGQRHVAVAIAQGKAVLLNSTDGTSWQESGSVPLPARSLLLGAATTGDNTYLAGVDQSGEDPDPMLHAFTPQGAAAVDLSKVPGAVQQDQTVTSVAATGDLAVAVGGTSGDAAVWTSSDGDTWRRATLASGLAPRAGVQRLSTVVSGSRGWLAAGIGGIGPRVPLVLTSADGTSWSAVTDKVFEPGENKWMSANGAAAGGPGYVIVGEDTGSAAVWFSADLKSWERGVGAGKHDLQADGGATRWMRSVVTGPEGFIAGGGLLEGTGGGLRRMPAVWSSADGKNWALRKLRLPQGFGNGTIERLAVSGQRVVAVGEGGGPNGTAPLVFVSQDGGVNWRADALPMPQGGSGARTTAVTAGPKGFLVAGVKSTGGTTDVVSWTSADGANWQVQNPDGTGLAGAGDQWIDALTVFRGTVIGVGTSAERRSEQPVLWRPALP